MPAKNTTRVFFVFEDLSRLLMDIDDRQLVGEVKEKVRHTLQLGVDETLAGSECHERKMLSLSYAGAILEDSWRFADLGIPYKAQVNWNSSSTLLNRNVSIVSFISYVVVISHSIRFRFRNSMMAALMRIVAA